MYFISREFPGEKIKIKKKEKETCFSESLFFCSTVFEDLCIFSFQVGKKKNLFPLSYKQYLPILQLQ